MRVEIFRVTGEPITVEVSGEGNVKDALSVAGSGKVIGFDDLNLIEAAEREYGGINGLGTIRVNGRAADLNTPVADGDVILLVPSVEGGLE